MGSVDFSDRYPQTLFFITTELERSIYFQEMSKSCNDFTFTLRI